MRTGLLSELTGEEEQDVRKLIKFHKPFVSAFGQVSPEYAKYRPGGTYEKEHGTIVEQQSKEAARRASDPLWYIKDWINAYILKTNAAQTTVKLQTISGLGREVRSSGLNVRGPVTSTKTVVTTATTPAVKQAVYTRPSTKPILVERRLITQEGEKTERYNIEVQKMTGYDVRLGGWNWLSDSINNILVYLGLQPMTKEKAWLTPEGKLPEVSFLSELERE